MFLELLAEQIADIFDEEWVPTALRGGRMAHLWKKKGKQAVRANHRGLLISDHIGNNHHFPLKK